MTQWQHILSDAPALLNGTTQSAQLQTLKNDKVVVPLIDRGILEVSGPDTNRLLQGQLTCDIEKLSPGETVPGALCDVKGRMISSFLAHRLSKEKIILVMHQGLTANTLATLKKYAVFYKTEVSDLSDQYLAIGLYQAQPPQETEGTLVLKQSDTRSLLLCPTAQGSDIWRDLSSSLKSAGLNFWEYLMIGDGDGEVRPETAEEFIPQMLNLQHTGAVNFRKGCYTGQEIVARMQYLGKLKRRMYAIRVKANTLIEPGKIVDTADRKSVGTVVMSQFSAAEQLDVLAVLTKEVAEQSEVSIEGVHYSFEILPLPYDDKFEPA